MHYSRNGLLCELHAHTTWSDGELTLPQLVDLYGSSGFDVLCVTDHCVRRDDPWLDAPATPLHVHAGCYDEYLASIEREALRAWRRYELLLVPGLELTYYHSDPRRSAHAVAVGLRRFVGVDDGLDAALDRARDAGAALIGAHPYSFEEAIRTDRGTARFAEEGPGAAARLVHRLELFNRHDSFPWVANARLPFVASGDFHAPEHLETWKTLVPCAKDEGALVDYLRSAAPVHLTRFAKLAAAA